MTEDNCHESRFFLTGGDTINDKDAIAAEGWLYIGLGVDYPKGVASPNDPFKSVVGEAHIVGRYLLSRSLTGWKMVVVHFGEVLDKDDPLYQTVFDFNTLIIPATD